MARPRKALVVDDLAVNRLVLRTILQKLGFEVLEAENGLECIDVYIQERTQLVCVFLDLQMPIADGWTATKGIRELESQAPDSDRLPVPVVVCTATCLDDLADNGQTVAQKSITLGANGAVRKPLTVFAVQRILDEHAPRWRCPREDDDPALSAASNSHPHPTASTASSTAAASTVTTAAATAAAPPAISHHSCCQGPKLQAQWSSCGQRQRPHYQSPALETPPAPGAGCPAAPPPEQRSEDSDVPSWGRVLLPSRPASWSAVAVAAGAWELPIMSQTCNGYPAGRAGCSGGGGGSGGGSSELCWVPRREREVSCGGGGGLLGQSPACPAASLQRRMSCEASLFPAAAAAASSASTVVAVLPHGVAVAVVAAAL